MPASAIRAIALTGMLCLLAGPALAEEVTCLGFSYL
jgi:hypothetical protein